MLPLSSWDIKISVVSQCRILVAVQYLNTQLSAFFPVLKLAPAGLLSDLVTIDADLRRLNLMTDSRLTSLETQTQIWNCPIRTALTFLCRHLISTSKAPLTQSKAALDPRKKRLWWQCAGFQWQLTLLSLHSVMYLAITLKHLFLPRFKINNFYELFPQPTAVGCKTQSTHKSR